MAQQLKIISVAFLAIALSACSGRQETTKDDMADTSEDMTHETADTQQVPTSRFKPSDLVDPNNILSQRIIYFDFDRSEVMPEYRHIVSAHAEYLSERTGARVTLEGHADERGTREYNLGLGEARGNSVSSLLRVQGSGSGQLDVVSLGEERPQCTGHSDDCWQQNRRVEIIYTAR